MKGLIAKKVGMTQVFDESGNLTPVTVIHVEPNVVVATKTKENCGYDAVVLGLDDMKASKVSKAYAGQFPENITPKRTLKEFRNFETEVKVGDLVGLELFEKTRFLDVTATSKGKGFQGVMKSTNEGTITAENINALYLNSRNDLWVAADNGLFIYDMKSRQLLAYMPNSSSTGNITAICQDGGGTMWLGTERKLRRSL